jgi:hypothetical protein
MADIITKADEKPVIKIKKTEFRESTIGAWLYTYYITFPTNPTWSYTIKATDEGIGYIVSIWKEAGYVIEWIEKA